MEVKEFNELKIKFSLSIGYSSASRKYEAYLREYIDEENWKAMNDEQKDKFLYEIAEEWSINYIDLNGWIE